MVFHADQSFRSDMCSEIRPIMDYAVAFRPQHPIYSYHQVTTVYLTGRPNRK